MDFKLLKKIFISLILLFCFSTVGFGQEVYTLKQLIEYGNANAISISKLQNQSDITTYEYKKNQSAYLPSLNGSGTHSYNFGRSVDRTTNQFTNSTLTNDYLSLNSSWDIFTGFQRMNQLKQNKYELESVKNLIEQSKNEMALTVSNLYLQILMQKERLKQLQSQTTISKENLERNKLLNKAGRLIEVRVLESEAQLANDESNVVQAENQMASLFLQLKQMVNMDVSKNIDIQVIEVNNPEESYTTQDLNKIITERLDLLPQLKKAKADIESNKYNKKIAQSGLMPSLSLFGSLSTSYSSAFSKFSGYRVEGANTIGYVKNSNEEVLSPNLIPIFQDLPLGTQFKDNLGQTLGLSLNIPIFNRLQTNLNIKQTELQIKGAELDSRDLSQKAKNDIYISYQNLQSGRKSYKASSIKEGLQRKLYEQAEASYKQGVMNFYELQQAKNQMQIAYSEFLSAKYNYFFSTKVFEFYLGKPLSIE